MPLKVQNVRETFLTEGQRTIKILVCGPPGAGKTLSASTWPHPLYADIEGRMLSVRDRDVHSVEIRRVADLEELRNDLRQKPEVREKVLGIPVETVIVDTVDELARLIIRERLIAEKQDAMKIADWGYLGDTLRSLLRGLRDLDLNVVLNVHLKSSEDSETGRIEYKPAIQGSVGDEIAGYVDEAFLLVARPTVDTKTGDRVLARHFQTYPDSQHTWVKDHSGTLPLEFPVNFADDYQRLASLIFGAPPERSTVQASAVLASSKTVGKNVPSHPRRPTADVKSAALAGEPVVQAPTPPEPVPVASGNGAGGSVCADCDQPVTNVDQVEISTAQWGVPLCRADFAARKNRQTA